jgi:hypothetical protein
MEELNGSKSISIRNAETLENICIKDLTNEELMNIKQKTGSLLNHIKTSLPKYTKFFFELRNEIYQRQTNCPFWKNKEVTLLGYKKDRQESFQVNIPSFLNDKANIKKPRRDIVFKCPGLNKLHSNLDNNSSNTIKIHNPEKLALDRKFEEIEKIKSQLRNNMFER